MAEDDRMTTLETRVDRHDVAIADVTERSDVASREARMAMQAHLQNVALLNAMRATQAEHTKTLVRHEARLDTIDGRLGSLEDRMGSIEGTLGGLTVGMHAIEGLLQRLVDSE